MFSLHTSLYFLNPKVCSHLLWLYSLVCVKSDRKFNRQVFSRHGSIVFRGARHGLKLNGKLARIEQQEKELLDRLTNKSANQTTDYNSVANSAIGQDSANEIGENMNKKQKKKKKRTTEDSAHSDQVENTESDCRLADEVEPHSKSCKKKRKKEKREKKSKDKAERECDSDFGSNLDSVQNETISDNLKAENDIKLGKTEFFVKPDISETNETAEDLTLRKVKKKKKKNKKTV